MSFDTLKTHKEYKPKQWTLHEALVEIQRLRKRTSNQRTALKQLHRAHRIMIADWKSMRQTLSFKDYTIAGLKTQIEAMANKKAWWKW